MGERGAAMGPSETHRLRLRAVLRAGVLAALSASGCVDGGPTVQMDSLNAREPVEASVEAGQSGLSDDGGSPVFMQGYPAPHAGLPRVQTMGGPVLAAPHFVPIFFPNDPDQAQIEEFFTQIQGSSYWTAATSEYGVGAMTVEPSVVVPDAIPASITDAQIEEWLSAYLDGTHPEFPPIAQNNVYVVFYPSATTIDLANGPSVAVSCRDFGGYHYEGNYAFPFADAGLEAGSAVAFDASAPTGPTFVYAVVPRCATFGTLNGLDAVTAATSHEMAEAATDPLVLSNPAFSLPDFDHIAWSYVGGGEVGDMCISESSDRVFQRLVGKYMVQRIWSNEAAEANVDPCVPGLASPYFNAAPDLDGTILLDDSQGNATFATIGTRVAVGQTVSIPVRLFSPAPTPDWYVVAIEDNVSGGANALQLAWDRQAGGNGDVLTLHVTRLSPGEVGGSALVFYSYVPNTSGSGNSWFAFIGN